MPGPLQSKTMVEQQHWGQSNHQGSKKSGTHLDEQLEDQKPQKQQGELQHGASDMGMWGQRHGDLFRT